MTSEHRPEAVDCGSDGTSERVAALLADARGPDDGRAAELLPLVYDELRQLARAQLAAERSGHTLQPTALVHEAFMRLSGGRRVPWQNRRHFFAAAAEAMRRVLLDHAKARGRQKRGGGRRRIPVDLAELAETWSAEEIDGFDDALSSLADEHPQVAEVVRFRFFAGLSIEHTAAALGISPATVKRRWELGRAWMFRALEEESVQHRHTDPERRSSS